MPTPPAPEAFFQPAPGGGQRLYLHHLPPSGTDVRGAVVFVHAWAEEMNKSRRMAALAARAMAAEGWAVLQFDLLGCGDSSGEFGDAAWSDWIADVEAAAAWMGERHRGRPMWLWGLRTGALLCADVAGRMQPTPHLLLWQPTVQGKAALQQFLRLKAASAIADGGAKAVLDGVRAELDAGRPVEIAGYVMSPALAAGLGAAALVAPTPVPTDAAPRLLWLDVTPQADPAASPAQQAAVARWRGAGWQVSADTLTGPAFWQTTEIEDAPALVTATLAGLGATEEEATA